MIVLVSKVPVVIGVEGSQERFVHHVFFQGEFNGTKVFTNVLAEAKKFSLPVAKAEAARLGLEIAQAEYSPLNFKNVKK